MKVSRVEVVPLRVPLEEAHRPHVSMESIFPTVVRLYTEAMSCPMSGVTADSRAVRPRADLQRPPSTPTKHHPK